MLTEEPETKKTCPISEFRTAADELEATESDLVGLPAILVPPPPPTAELKFRSMGRLASLVN